MTPTDLVPLPDQVESLFEEWGGEFAEHRAHMLARSLGTGGYRSRGWQTMLGSHFVKTDKEIREIHAENQEQLA